MNIADQLPEVRIFFADNGFIPVLKKVAMSPMPNVIRNSITGKKAAHIRRQPPWPTSKKDMGMLFKRAQA